MPGDAMNYERLKTRVQKETAFVKTTTQNSKAT